MDTEENEWHRTEFDPSTTPPSVALVEAIAAAEGVEPTDLLLDEDATLQDYIEMNALNQLLTGPQQEIVTVTFAVEEYDVRIRSSGAIEIYTN